MALCKRFTLHRGGEKQFINGWHWFGSLEGSGRRPQVHPHPRGKRKPQAPKGRTTYQLGIPRCLRTGRRRERKWCSRTGRRTGAQVVPSHPSPHRSASGANAPVAEQSRESQGPQPLHRSLGAGNPSFKPKRQPPHLSAAHADEAKAMINTHPVGYLPAQEPCQEADQRQAKSQLDWQHWD